MVRPSKGRSGERRNQLQSLLGHYIPTLSLFFFFLNQDDYLVLLTLEWLLVAGVHELCSWSASLSSVY